MTQFWAVADLFRKKGADWAPTNAGYESRDVIDVDGAPWTMCLKVHVVSEKDGDTERERLHFKSSISLWPPSSSKANEKRLEESGWYAAIERAMTQAGYEGQWHASPQGTFGDFWKDLARLSEVRREAQRLETIRLRFPESLEERPRRSSR